MDSVGRRIVLFLLSAMLLQQYGTPVAILLQQYGMPLKSFVAVAAQSMEAANALRSAGYSVIADHLVQLGSSGGSFSSSALPQEFTLFAPTDTAFSSFLQADALNRGAVDDDVVRYHMATRMLLFSNLTSLPLGARIDTLLPHYTIAVTSLEGEILRAGHLSLDGVQVIEPDLFVGDGIAVHGIGEVLNPYVFDQIANMPPGDLVHSISVLFVDGNPDIAD